MEEFVQLGVVTISIDVLDALSNDVVSWKEA